MQLMRYYDFFGIRKSEVHIITSERTAFISPYNPPAIVNLRLVIIVIFIPGIMVLQGTLDSSF